MTPAYAPLPPLILSTPPSPWDSVPPVDPDALTQLTRVLSLSITPVALISGVGLLLLSMTNRLGRVIDRARDLERAGSASGEPGHLTGAPELRILFRRARLLQIAIALIATLRAAVRPASPPRRGGRRSSRYAAGAARCSRGDGSTR